MRKSAVIALTLPLLALTACYDGYGHPGYAYNVGVAYPYEGYYDGFYGPIYDGYWGGDGFFYYRRGAGDRGFVRGDRDHFAREARNDGRFQPLRGEFRPDQRGMRTPQFRGDGNRGGDRGRDHGHDHDRR